MYTGVSVKHLVPEEFLLQHPASVSKSIIKRDIQRHPAYNPGPYGQRKTPVTVFRISSPQDFIDLVNSYFTITLRSGNEPANNGYGLTRLGVHGLFERVEVRGLGNIPIQDQEYYHLWSQVEKLTCASDEIFEDEFLSGDVVEWTSVDGPYRLGPNTGAATLGLPLRARQARASQDDRILKTTTDGVQVGGAIAQLRKKEGTITFFNGGTLGADAVGDSAALIRTVPEVNRIEYDEAYNRTYAFRPRMSFFKLMFPLFLSKSGIEIRFFWAPGHVSSISAEANGDLAAVSQVEAIDFTFWANMVTPHPDLLAEWTDLWGSVEGIKFTLPSCKVQIKQSTTNTGEESMSLNFNVRSARSVHVVTHTLFAFWNDNAWAKANDIGIFGNYNIDRFQARVGSDQFPLEPVEDQLSTRTVRALKHFYLAGKTNVPSYHWLRRTDQWQQQDGAVVSGPDTYLMTFDFARYTGLGAELSGIDLASVPVDLTFRRDATFLFSAAEGADGDRFQYEAFCKHDTYLKMSSQQISRIE